MPKVWSDLDFQNQLKINQLPEATLDHQPVVLSQLNSAIEGLKFKDDVVVATNGNIDIASPGPSINGTTLSNGDRVLVKDQTNPEQNGIYIFNGASSPLTRSNDANTTDELENAIISVSGGQAYRVTSVGFVLDTDPVNLIPFGTGASAASESTSGIAEIATQAEVDLGVDDQRFITPAKLKNYVDKKLKLADNFGDGSATQYDITHNFGTIDVTVQVFDTVSNQNVICDISRLDANTVRINTGIAPVANGLRYVILG